MGGAAFEATLSVSDRPELTSLAVTAIPVEPPVVERAAPATAVDKPADPEGAEEKKNNGNERAAESAKQQSVETTTEPSDDEGDDDDEADVDADADAEADAGSDADADVLHRLRRRQYRRRHHRHHHCHLPPPPQLPSGRPALWPLASGPQANRHPCRRSSPLLFAAAAI